MNCLNHPDRAQVAFCQNCGKPVCAECMRAVGSAVFCEPCLEARLAAAGSAAGAPFGSGPTTASVNYGAPAEGYAASGVEGIPDAVRGGVPGSAAPNPVLALLLGFLPGVGAMYNGQYAKGVVHLIIFAVLVSLADQHAIFGMFVAGWVAYQAFEAYHTAKARRDGTPLPNPFGLNDLGERLGFGKAWGAVAPGVSVPPAGPTPSPFTPGEATGTTQGTSASRPSYAPYTAPYTAPSANPYVGATEPYPGASQYAPWDPASMGTSYAGTPAAGSVTARRISRFPVGAVVLIGLGVLFLIGNAGWAEGFPISRLLPFLLIGLGVWIFIRRMLDTGVGFADDGTPGYRLRVYRALRGSIWVLLVGVLFLLDSFRILSWDHSWPLFIIVGGVVAILERTAYASAGRLRYGVPVSPIPPVAPVGVSTAATSSVSDSMEVMPVTLGVAR